MTTTARGFFRHCLTNWSGQITLLLGAYVLLFLLWQLFGWGGEAYRVVISDAAFLPVSLAAGAVALRAAGRPGLEPGARRGWRLIGLAFLTYWVGDLLWYYYEAILGVDPFPSVADLFYLVQYPLLLWGVLSLPVEKAGRSDWAKFWLDAATVLISGWVVTWFLVLGPTAEAGFGSLDRLLSVAYPVGDLLVFFGIVVIIYRRRDRSSFAARGLLALSLVLLFLGDLAYGRLSLADRYQAGGWPDSLWILGQYLTVVAGQYRFYQAPLADAEEREKGAALGTFLPYVSVALTYGLLLFTVRLNNTAEGLLLGAVAVTVTVMARQVVVLRENAQLLTNRVELLDEIRRSEVRFRSLVQNSSDVIAVVEAGALIRYMSPSLRGVLGHSPEHMVGLPLTGLLHPADVPGTLAALGEPGSGTIQCRLRHADGRWLHAEATVNNLLHDPDVCGIVLNLRDVTERKALEEQLTHQAFHDSLTDLANRALLRDRVQHALSHQQRRGEPVAVLFLDLDGFKTVNDSLGHAAGDELLMQVSRRLVGCVRGADTVARLGGDEFAVLMEGAGAEAAAQVAERIAQVLSRSFTVMGKEVFVYGSTGIAISRGGESADDLLRNADVAMYTAKAQGKGLFALFHPSMHAAALERLELEADLRGALEQSQFLLHYQPVVQLSSGEIAGVEALVRWRHPS
ncbi:MAG TPA: diguanylate cyclase, partial [Symbiobacteriaceae bacterium]|nr:diguanylate cyclase [Symbiobacteriaceae bacterium]